LAVVWGRRLKKIFRGGVIPAAVGDVRGLEKFKA
jgi:hypothetical protein